MTTIKIYEKNSELFAFFVNEFHDCNNVLNVGYVHNGQHVSISKEYLKGAKLVDPNNCKSDFLALIRELVYDCKYDNLHIANFNPRRRKINNINLLKVVESYKECLLWAYPDEDSDGFTDMTIHTFSENFNRAIMLVCTIFCSKFNNELLPLTTSKIGHALYLSQHRHGSGFFDYAGRELDNGAAFQMDECTKNFKEFHPYVKNSFVYAD